MAALRPKELIDNAAISALFNRFALMTSLNGENKHQTWQKVHFRHCFKRKIFFRLQQYFFNLSRATSPQQNQLPKLTL